MQPHLPAGSRSTVATLSIIALGVDERHEARKLKVA